MKEPGRDGTAHNFVYLIDDDLAVLRACEQTLKLADIAVRNPQAFASVVAKTK